MPKGNTPKFNTLGFIKIDYIFLAGITDDNIHVPIQIKITGCDCVGRSFCISKSNGLGECTFAVIKKYPIGLLHIGSNNIQMPVPI